MPDPEAVVDEGQQTDPGPAQGESEGSARRLWPLAVVLLLLLLLCCLVTSLEVFVSGGVEQARFVARNLQCLQCHREQIPEFSKPVVHSPFLHQECTICHTPHGGRITVTVAKDPSKSVESLRTLVEWLPLRWVFALYEDAAGVRTVKSGSVVSATQRDVVGGKSELVAPGDKLCWICHGDVGALLGDQYQHKPFASGQCLSCHDPHASDFSALLVEAPNRICFTCHPLGNELARKQVHPPAAEGWCIDCHNPHASNYRAILVAPQRKVCFTCHQDVASLASLAVQHQPYEYSNCSGCHQPHGSMYEPLLNQPQPQLCYKCHPNIENQFAEPSHHPVQVKLECGDCHQPHASQYAWLLDATDNNVCYTCHGDKRATYEASPHSVNLCINCHTPHGSQFAPLLIQSNPELCYDCHPSSSFSQIPGQTHPVSPAFFDIHAGKGLTCTSTCHNPHGSQYDHMLRNFFYPQDGLCLQCHSYVGITF